MFRNAPHDPTALRRIRQPDAEVLGIEPIVLFFNKKLIGRVSDICADSSAQVEGGGSIKAGNTTAQLVDIPTYKALSSDHFSPGEEGGDGLPAGLVDSTICVICEQRRKKTMAGEVVPVQKIVEGLAPKAS